MSMLATCTLPRKEKNAEKKRKIDDEGLRMYRNKTQVLKLFLARLIPLLNYFREEI